MQRLGGAGEVVGRPPAEAERGVEGAVRVVPGQREVGGDAVVAGLPDHHQLAAGVGDRLVGDVVVPELGGDQAGPAPGGVERPGGGQPDDGEVAGGVVAPVEGPGEVDLAARPEGQVVDLAVTVGAEVQHHPAAGPERGVWRAARAEPHHEHVRLPGAERRGGVPGDQDSAVALGEHDGRHVGPAAGHVGDDRPAAAEAQVRLAVRQEPGEGHVVGVLALAGVLQAGRVVPPVGHVDQRLRHVRLGGPRQPLEGGPDVRRPGGEVDLLVAIGVGVVDRLNREGGRRLPGGDDHRVGDGRLVGVRRGEPHVERLRQVGGAAGDGADGPKALGDGRIGQRQGQAGGYGSVFEPLQPQASRAQQAGPSLTHAGGLAPTHGRALHEISDSRPGRKLSSRSHWGAWRGRAPWGSHDGGSEKSRPGRM